MDPIIVQTSAQIKEKGTRLQQKTGMMLKAIRCNQTNTISNKSQPSKKGTNGTLFWSIAAVTAVTAIFAPYKPISIAVCGCAIIGGVKSLMNNNDINSSSQENVYDSTNQLTNQLLNVIKTIKNEWDDFLKQKKATIQNYIKSLDVDEETRSKLYSFSYVTESIKFPVSEILNDMNKISTSNDFIASFAALKDKLNENFCSSIDMAVNKQIAKYEEIGSIAK